MQCSRPKRFVIGYDYPSPGFIPPEHHVASALPHRNKAGALQRLLEVLAG
jgi:hypothetical protein